MSLLPCLVTDLSAICYNYRLCKNLANTSQTAAVVKNNGYGLGAKIIAKSLYEKENCRIFFVAYAAEGDEIRAVVPDASIYLLNGFCREDLPLVKKSNLVPVISSTTQIDEWNESPVEGIRPALQVETGLHRLGITLKEIMQMSPEQRNNFSLILSHLGCADEPLSPQNETQCAQLQKIKSFFPKSLISLSASDGIGLGEKYHFDIVRAGAFMYGLPVCPALTDKQKNVIDAYANVLQIKNLNAGDTVGYNATFVAKENCRTAAVGIGYGDGFFRSLSNKGQFFFKADDKYYAAPIIGRVSMDITMCDVSNIPDKALENGKAYLFSNTYTLEEMGKDAGTIGYEVLSALGLGERWVRTFI